MSSVLWNATEDVERLRGHFAEMLRGRIAVIHDLSGVPAEFIEPINPCDHLIRNSYIEIDGYPYKNEDKFYAEKPREIFRVSPLDEPRKTAEQIAYKHNENAVRIGARKCKVAFVGKAALSFYSANHRQGLMNTTANAVSAALLHDGEIVALMTYDKTAGGVRGAKKDYELLRLAIKRGVSVPGGASKLQKALEDRLRDMGETSVFSYSNATINNGDVYAALGFKRGGCKVGQKIVLTRSGTLTRLLALAEGVRDIRSLALYKRLTTYLSANIFWEKALA